MELQESQQRRPPYGDLLTYPLSRFRYLHQTSGGIERALLSAFRSQLDIRVAVGHAEAGSLPRYELKARRFKRIGDR